MEIYRYEIIGKHTNKNRPFFDKKKGLFIFKLKGNYNWWCQAKLFNNETGCYDYYLLFSKEKFCDTAFKCHKDDFGKYRLSVSDEFKDWLTEYYDIDSGNFNIEYVETINNYDVYSVE